MSEPAVLKTLDRAGWIEAADRLLRPLDRYRSVSGALISLPGRPSWSGERSDGLEGYARSFLLVAFRVVAEPGVAHLLNPYRAGLVAGTTPGHPDSWPPIVARGQPFVEAASIAIALDLTRDLLWDSLSTQEKLAVAEWLQPSGEVETPPNNWVLFRLVIQEFLAGSGFPHRESVILDALDRWNGWYRGEGWFTDGDGQRFDYYNAWAFHVYPLLWSRMRGRRDPASAEQVRAVARERLREFLLGYVRLFGGDGMPIYQGRSLTYRFASLSALWMGEAEGVSPLTPLELRRLASATLSGFLDRGATDERGLLTSGWLGAFPPMVQPYSGPASPYWASKGFLGLLLPADAPVWTAPDGPAPAADRNTVLLLRAPGFLLSTTASDGLSRLVNHGSDNVPPLTGVDDPHYSRFAYSSATAPSFDPEPVDNHIALIDAAGRASRRGAIARVDVGAEAGGSAHTPFWGSDPAEIVPAEGTTITTASVADGAHIVHIHVIETRAPEALSIRIGGFALAGPEAPRADCTGRVARTETDALVSVLHGLSDGLSPGIRRSRHTSPYGDHAAVPVLTGEHTGAWSVHVVSTELRGAAVVGASPPIIVSIELSEAGLVVSIRFRDRSPRDVTVRIPCRTDSSAS